jgi:hypothetical protein
MSIEVILPLNTTARTREHHRADTNITARTRTSRASARRRRRQHDAHRAVLEHWRVHQPENCRRRMGKRHGSITGSAHPKHDPNGRGYSASNLWPMSQFLERYRGQPKLAPLVRELSWSHNLAIWRSHKRDEEREFYLRMATQERWSFREPERQLNGGLFKRVVLSPTKLAPALRELHPDATLVGSPRLGTRSRPSRRVSFCPFLLPPRERCTIAAPAESTQSAKLCLLALVVQS